MRLHCVYVSTKLVEEEDNEGEADADGDVDDDEAHD